MYCYTMHLGMDLVMLCASNSSSNLRQGAMSTVDDATADFLKTGTRS